MKKIILLLTLLSFTLGNSQILNPVKWTTSVEKISETEYVLLAKASIEKNWHLYSQNVPENGPIPTSFTYPGTSNYLKKGNTIEEKGYVIHDPVFDMKIKYFENSAVFKQHIKLKNKEFFKINATVEFMACDDKRCLPPTEVDLVFIIK